MVEETYGTFTIGEPVEVKKIEVIDEVPTEVWIPATVVSYEGMDVIVAYRGSGMREAFRLGEGLLRKLEPPPNP